MTNNQKVEAYRMLLDGYTMQAVADKFGVTRQRIQQIFPGVCKQYTHADYIYPNIARWMNENRVSAKKFSEAVGSAYSTFLNWMHGNTEPGKWYIDRILSITGMTYEEAFSGADAAKETEFEALRNELCLMCGKYSQAHEGACDGCRWKGV